MESELQGFHILHGLCVCVCAKELLAESERAVSVPQCHMGADSDNGFAMGACDCYWLGYRDNIFNHLLVHATRTVVEQIHRWDVHRQFDVLVSKRVAEHYDGCDCVGTTDS
jgi:hypothetical protein